MSELFRVTHPDEPVPMFALRLGQDRLFAFSQDTTQIVTLDRLDAGGYALTPVVGCEHIPIGLDVTVPAGYAGPAIVTSDGVPAVLLAPDLVGVPAMERRMDRPPRPVFDLYGIESWERRGQTVAYGGDTSEISRDSVVHARGPDGLVSFLWPCGTREAAPRYGLWAAGALLALALMRRK